MIGIVLPVADERILSALTLQRCKDFTVYTKDEVEEPKLNIVKGGWLDVAEPLLAFLEPGATPGPNYVKRILKATRRHPEFDVYHMNVEGGKAFPRKTSDKKFFKMVAAEDFPAPLSSFVFRAERLRRVAVFKADGITIDTIPSVLMCMGTKPLRGIWRGTIGWNEPSVSEEHAIMDKLELFHFSESYFGDKDYPLSVGAQMALFAEEIVKLYPARNEQQLKELMDSFDVAKGTVRKMRANSALKKAIKEKQEQ